MRIGLAIPHAAHYPGRKESLDRLLACAGATRDVWPGADEFRIFADRQPHWEWSRAMWTWGRDTGVDWLVSIQDDTVVPHNFMPAFRALVTMNPANVLALMGIHPLAKEVARQGGKMHRTRAWALGNGWALSKSFLSTFVPWVESHEQDARTHSEDALINRYCVETAQDVWHPVPSLVDHDTTVDSTWNANNNGHRRATVTWREYMPHEITEPEFWRHSGEVRLFTDSLRPRCWCCLEEDAFISFHSTGVHVGPTCFARMAQEASARMLKVPA